MEKYLEYVWVGLMQETLLHAEVLSGVLVNKIEL